MNLEEKRKFFAHRPNTTTVNMNGKKLALANLPEEIRKKVLDRLAEKDEVMAKGKAGILPGIKINGIQVTRDNIKDFEKKIPAEHKEKEIKDVESPRESVEVVEEVIDEEKKEYSMDILKKMSFKELRELGKEFGIKGRGKVELIGEILNLQ